MFCVNILPLFAHCMSVIEGYAASDKEERCRSSLTCLSTQHWNLTKVWINASKYKQKIRISEENISHRKKKKNIKHGFYNSKNKSGNNELMINNYFLL